MEPSSEAPISTPYLVKDGLGTDNAGDNASTGDNLMLPSVGATTTSGVSVSTPPLTSVSEEDPDPLYACTPASGYDTPLDSGRPHATLPCNTPDDDHFSNSSSMGDPTASGCSKPRKKVTCFFDDTPSHYDSSPDQLTPRRRRNQKILLVDTECSISDVKNALGQDVCNQCNVTACEDYYTHRSLYLVLCYEASILPLAASRFDMAMLPYVTHGDWYVCVTDYGCIQELYRVALADKTILPYVRVCSYDTSSKMALIGKPDTGLPNTCDLLLRMMVWSQKKATAVHTALGGLAQHNFCGPYTYSEASGGLYSDLFQGLVQSSYGKRYGGTNAEHQNYETVNPQDFLYGASWWGDGEWKNWSAALQQQYQVHPTREVQATQDSLAAMNAAILRPAVRTEEAVYPDALVPTLQQNPWPYGKGWVDPSHDEDGMRAWGQQHNVRSDFGVPPSAFFGNPESQSCGPFDDAAARSLPVPGVVHTDMYPPMDVTVHRAPSMPYSSTAAPYAPSLTAFAPTAVQYTPASTQAYNTLSKGATSSWKPRPQSSENTKWQRAPLRYTARPSKGSANEEPTKKRNPHHPIPPIGSGYKGHKGERQIVCMNPFYMEQVAAIIARKEQKELAAKGKKGSDAKGGGYKGPDGKAGGYKGPDAKGHKGSDGKDGGHNGSDAKGGQEGSDAKKGHKGYDAKGGHKGFFGAGKGDWETGKGWNNWDSSAESQYRNTTLPHKNALRKGKGLNSRQWKRSSEE